MGHVAVRKLTNMKLVIVVFITAAATQTILRCTQWRPSKEIRYHFRAKCKRSVMKAISAITVSNMEECQFWANRQRAFAFNFMHDAESPTSANPDPKENCITFECPELNIRRVGQYGPYNYYSSFLHSSDTNVSCIPKLGVFQLHVERKNYDSAEKTCSSEGSILADIGTDLHTTQLASLLANLNVTLAYVGLKHWNYTEDEYLTSRGLPLSCLRFRAWAPMEPRQINKTKCVVLTSKGFWRVRNCDRKMAFLCELKTRGTEELCNFHHSEKIRRCHEARSYHSARKNNRRYSKCSRQPEERQGISEQDNIDNI